MWANLQENVVLVTFTEKIFNAKLHFYAVFSGISMGTKIWTLSLKISQKKNATLRV